jgi:hypothetical protein
MGGACGTYGGEERFWWGDLRERDEFEGLCVDGRTILKLIFKKWDGGMDWIDLARDWPAVSNTVMNFLVQ